MYNKIINARAGFQIIFEQFLINKSIYQKGKEDYYYEYFKCRKSFAWLWRQNHFQQCIFSAVKRWTYRIGWRKRGRKIYLYEYYYRHTCSRWGQSGMGKKCTYRLSWSAYRAAKRNVCAQCSCISVWFFIRNGNTDERSLW